MGTPRPTQRPTQGSRSLVGHEGRYLSGPVGGYSAPKRGKESACSGGMGSQGGKGLERRKLAAGDACGPHGLMSPMPPLSKYVNCPDINRPLLKFFASLVS